MPRVRDLVVTGGALALVTACATGERAALPRLEPAAARSFEPALVARGAELAAIGDCQGCHTSEGGRAFAGARPLDTPFGTIYSTNITPDPDTGIGRWSEAAFVRAMREGVDRAGHDLYPAFPYDHFTLVSDADDRAIYAYLMTRAPVRARHPANRLAFPFNIRALIGVWKALYFRPGPYRPDPARDASWNRGAYLAEGLGHCGSCHTPRNALGAEVRERHFDGGEAEGWHAYAIDAQSHAPTSWNVQSLTQYLRSGWQRRHGVSRGPMVSVTESLANASEADVRAIAAYVASRMQGRASPAPPPRSQRAAMAGGVGERLFRTTCEQCHDGSRAMPFGGIPLDRSIGVAGESARNLVNLVLYGLPPAEGRTAPIMPAYGGALDDAQVVELARFLRARFTREPPWGDLERVVREARAAGPKVASPPAGGTGSDPAQLASARR